LGQNATSSTYGSDYRNNDGSVDQGHHFAAFFQFGYCYVLGDTEASAALEIAQSVMRGQSLNTGDIRLGAAAASLGAKLAVRAISPRDLGRIIRDDICDK
jgi:hypothetical protein